MVDIIFGNQSSNLTLSVAGSSRWDSDRFVEVFDAQASFSVEGFRSEFRTIFAASAASWLRDKIRNFVSGSSKAVTFECGLDNVPDVLVELRAEDDDEVSAVVTFALSRSAREPHLRLSDWVFEGQLEFGFEKSALADLESSLEALQGQQRPRA